MNVFVTGMEMPENCWNCPFCGMSLCDEKATWSCTAYECRIIAITSIRQEWCPLRPERKTGRWIDMGDFEQCSACKGTHLKEFQSCYGKTIWIRTPYCPYCGAKLEVEHELGNS